MTSRQKSSCCRFLRWRNVARRIKRTWCSSMSLTLALHQSKMSRGRDNSWKFELWEFTVGALLKHINLLVLQFLFYHMSCFKNQEKKNIYIWADAPTPKGRLILYMHWRNQVLCSKSTIYVFKYDLINEYHQQNVTCNISVEKVFKQLNIQVV